MEQENVSEQEIFYAQAEGLLGDNSDALQSMAVMAWGARKSKEAMRIYSFVWGRNARSMAKSVDMFRDSFETNHPNSVDELLSMFAIASLGRASAAKLAADWQNKTLAYWQVRERVSELKQRKPKESKPNPLIALADCVIMFADHLTSCNIGIGNHQCTCGYTDALFAWTEARDE